MKFKTHPHRSDLLTLTKSDLDKIANGEILQISALVISLEPEPKPDMVYYGRLDEPARGGYTLGSCFTTEQHGRDQLKLTFDGQTGKLKSAEVL
jgi:hypothetical protein